MTLDELKDFLRKSGIKDFNVVVNDVGPTNEWTIAEQEEDCCQEVPDHDPCVEDGKVEPWNGWTEELEQELGYSPGPSEITVAELFANAERTYGKGNVHLKVNRVGPNPCGEKITTWVDTLSCCETPAELIKFGGDTAVNRGDTRTYSVLTGTGELPVTWDVIGAGVSVAKSDSTSARATFGDCFCTPVVIYAQDTCLSVAPWVVSPSDGSWASIADESLSSPFGWFQDGTTGHFYLLGFNSDNTKVSTQYYWEAEYIGTKEVVCGSTMPGINEDPIVTSQDSQGFEKCDGANIWVRLKEGFSNVWTVRYALDNQGTSEYTIGTCEDELAIDEDGSLEVLADNSFGNLEWIGGVPPFSIVVSGEEIYVDSGRTITEKYNHVSRDITLYSGDSCGGLYATVTDSCGVSVEHPFRATTGYWDYIPNPENPMYYYGALHKADEGRITGGFTYYSVTRAEYKLNVNMALYGGSTFDYWTNNEGDYPGYPGEWGDRCFWHRSYRQIYCYPPGCLTGSLDPWCLIDPQWYNPDGKLRFYDGYTSSYHANGPDECHHEDTYIRTYFVAMNFCTSQKWIC